MEQTVLEEKWNAISHGVGILLGVVGLIVLLFFNNQRTDFSTMSIIFYGLSVIVLYTSSTIYHAVRDVKWKNIWRKFDHISIYFLIAGTYTPVSLITLERGSGWLIFWIVWGIAAIGTLLKIFFTGKFEILSLLLYLAMGWLIVFDLNDLVANTTFFGLNLLMLGGAFYTIGILFYVIKKIPYNHVIWHFFVLGGSISHFFFILLDVV
ncbi:PAQR family membrane homeostasis protein TrhA [Abyssalbus ytuae]|uniref:Hemolysin III family protein n=1 Tax=Abyssalbus ytuae TaxID=2926907 RepID=A0A9E6ZMR9_9FLAO|nr:hemolysin III family protein [Abyssalbus ytuae]UOB17195.1 hemolysin III family protein [Abyssalbus ytuae]